MKGRELFDVEDAFTGIIIVMIIVITVLFYGHFK